MTVNPLWQRASPVRGCAHARKFTRTNKIRCESNEEGLLLLVFDATGSWRGAQRLLHNIMACLQTGNQIATQRVLFEFL